MARDRRAPNPAGTGGTDDTADDRGDDRYGRWYPLNRFAIAPFLKFLVRVYQPGLAHVPTHGPAILAPNHISFLDSALLMATLPRQIRFVGKAEYFGQKRVVCDVHTAAGHQVKTAVNYEATNTSRPVTAARVLVLILG